MKKFNLIGLQKFSKNIRRNILFEAKCGGSSSAHIGGALSCVDILSVLFFNIMKIDIKKKLEVKRDRFILSKGHGCLAYYGTLVEKKFIAKKELETFEKNESNLLGHPVINRDIGIEFSNGSLGMGLSLGIGVAISFKKKKINNRIFVLIGDGECNEGSVWEAAMFAPNKELHNLIAIIDHNKFQQTGSNKEIMDLKNLSNKWLSFGWNVIEVNGHDINELLDAFNKKFENTQPKLIIANTVKGKGFSFSEDNNEWHHRILTQKTYDEAIEELDK